MMHFNAWYGYTCLLFGNMWHSPTVQMVIIIIRSNMKKCVGILILLTPLMTKRYNIMNIGHIHKIHTIAPRRAMGFLFVKTIEGALWCFHQVVPLMIISIPLYRQYSLQLSIYHPPATEINGHHWLKRLVSCSKLSHYRNHSWCIVNENRTNHPDSVSARPQMIHVSAWDQITEKF